MDYPTDSNRPKFSPRNRRVTPRELQKTITRLRRKLRKEVKRADKIRMLKSQINILANEVQSLINNPSGDCTDYVPKPMGDNVVCRSTNTHLYSKI